MGRIESKVNMNKTKKVKPHHLHCDLILDIFSRLPAKSLSRFRCVSKDFLNYISSPCLHQLHYHRSSKKPFSISIELQRGSDYLSARKLDFDVEVKRQLLLSTADHEGRPISRFTEEIEIHGYYGIWFVPSHHNLVCITTENHIYICNPSKQEFVALPKGSNFRSGCFGAGFGYLPSKNEYKVVRIFYRKFDRYDPNNNELGCEILSISNYGSGRNNDLINSCSAWRVLEEGCPHLMDAGPVLVNGSVHWKIDTAWNRGEDEQIMSFNLKDEKFWILPVPDCVKRDPELFKLVELRKELWLNHVEDGNRHVINMWVLKDFDKFTWVKEYSIDFSLINKTDRYPYVLNRYPYVLNVYGNEGLVIGMAGKIFYFNIETKSLTDRGPRSNYRSKSYFCYYTDVVSFH